jgi:hypothetical protein
VSKIITPSRILEPNVPAGYEKRLKAIHRGLHFKWNPHGGLTGYWEIWWRNDNNGKDSHAITVGCGVYYKPLTEEVFQILRRGDSHRIGIKSIIDTMDAQDELIAEQREKEIEHISEEALRDEAQMERLTQKPIGVATEGEYKKPKGRIVG